MEIFAILQIPSRALGISRDPWTTLENQCPIQNNHIATNTGTELYVRGKKETFTVNGERQGECACVYVMRGNKARTAGLEVMAQGKAPGLE